MLMLSTADFFFFFFYFKNIAPRVPSECQTFSIQIDQDRRSIGSDSDPNRLQRLPAVSEKWSSGNEMAEHNDARKLGLLMRSLGFVFRSTIV